MRCIAFLHFSVLHFRIAQSFSRFVARRAGLAGRNDMELARADMVALHSYYDSFDCLVELASIWFVDEPSIETPESDTHLTRDSPI